MSQLCLQYSGTQSKRDYRIARICLQRAFMHENTELSTQVFLPALLYINLYSGEDFRLVTFSYSSSQWSIYDASFCFLIRHFNPLPAPVQIRLDVYCHVRVQEMKKRNKERRCHTFHGLSFQAYSVQGGNTGHSSPSSQPVCQRVISLQWQRETNGTHKFALKNVFHQWLFNFIFTFKYTITWPRMRSLVLEHPSLTLSPTWLFFTVSNTPLHWSIFLSQLQHFTSLFHFLFGPRPLFGPMGILSQVIIHHCDSFLSVQDKDSC